MSRVALRFTAGAALFLVGCSDSMRVPIDGPKCVAFHPDAQAPPADASGNLMDGGSAPDASGNPVDGAPAPDASGNPIDGAPVPVADAAPGAHPEVATIPIESHQNFKLSPVPLSESMGATDSESRAQLVNRLRDHVLSTTELFRPYSYVAANWAKAAEDAIAIGWQANQEPPLPMVPPIDWGDDHDDPNWHFQLNSLRPGIPFGYATWETDDVVNLRRMLAVVDDWIDYNLIEDHENSKKWYDMGAGLRAHYIGVTLAELLRRGPGVPEAAAGVAFDETVEKLVWAMHVHGAVLADPAVFPAGNHSLFMMLGLATVCRVIPEFAECEAWRSYAEAGVERYLCDTVSSEDVTLEHSPAYHRFVAVTLKEMGATTLFDGNLNDVAEGMFDNLLWMYHPNTEMALVGDSEGQAVPGENAYLDYVLSQGARGAIPLDAPVGFFDAGFAILRDPWSQVPFSAHSYLFFSAAHHSAAHKHADDFTFEWSRHGVPIILDSGKFEYKAGPERTFFTSTRASNTIEVDGMSHWVGGVAAYGSALKDVGKTTSGVQYAAAIATRVPSDVRHARVLAMHDDWLLVADRLTSGTPHVYRQWLGLHENFDVIGLASDLAFSDGRETVVRLIPLADHDEFESARGQSDPLIQGWISHAYQTRVARWSIASRVTASNATMAILLATPDVTSAYADPVGDKLEVTIESAGIARHYTVAFGLTEGSLTE